MTPEEEAEYKRRQKGRNLALAAVLVFLVLLFYALTFAKMG